MSYTNQSISLFEIRIYTSGEYNCTYIKYVCVCRCVGIYGHVLRAWLPLAVQSWAALAPEERVSLSLAGMCVREKLPETPLIRAQCCTVRGADTKPAQIHLQQLRRLSAGSFRGFGAALLRCLRSYDGFFFFLLSLTSLDTLDFLICYNQW